MAEMKERLEETEVMEDIGERKEQTEIPKEVKPWLKEVDKRVSEASGMRKIGQAVVVPSGQNVPKVSLPVSQRSFVSGLKKKVSEAGRWLSAFIARLIKMKKGNVEFKEEE